MVKALRDDPMAWLRLALSLFAIVAVGVSTWTLYASAVDRQGEQLTSIQAGLTAIKTDVGDIKSDLAGIRAGVREKFNANDNDHRRYDRLYRTQWRPERIEE